MKWKTLLLILVAVLLVTAVTNATPVLINRGLFTREIVNHQPEYTLHYIPTPSWWPH
ncbi:MAG: hypothetical protein KKG09_08560 [Verrucomicrobia bacterium]|nr:hypothetical protein [Verrucomicrobiota bacterium]MBU4247230.1 hypothetical protein [Verrucomicrobiota bacterium]MBU4289964.1 hypothetical protein [Verrucomicrobiota bacterium]MBU4498041.1 hypothetical protein [Verrucomicrobiota bacterium]MCG2679688.1 hypothetical protein [Kiritimatiellia bacterium]